MLPRETSRQPTFRSWRASLPPGWAGQDFVGLQHRLEQQRERKPRIRRPAGEDVCVRWGLVCTCYQPELALGWSACTGNFAREAKQDRVFEESRFWVVTRTLQCFY